MVTAQDILKAAALLPETQRAELIEALFATFEASPPEAESAANAWRQTAATRAAELDSAAATTVPWDEVRQEGERRIHDRPTR